MRYYTRPSRATGKYYVNRVKETQEQAYRDAEIELALEASLAAEATSAAPKSPFLAYHAECHHWECELAAWDALLAHKRYAAQLRAYYAVH